MAREQLFRIIIILICLLQISGCKSSPWDDCPKSCQSERFSVKTNLALLKKREMSIQNSTGRTDFKIALIADSQRHPEDLDRVISLINGRREEFGFILFLGDLTDTGLAMEFDWVCRILKKIDLPFFTVVGNHDLLNYGEEIWRDVFGPLDYSLSVLGTRFILFNDNKLEYTGAPNLDFVRTEARVGKGETRFHTIVAAHVPPTDRTVFRKAERQEIKDTFAASGIEVSIHGHLHHFSYAFDASRNLYQYIIGRVENCRYGILTVTPASFRFENCSGRSCRLATPE